MVHSALVAAADSTLSSVSIVITYSFQTSHNNVVALNTLAHLQAQLVVLRLSRRCKLSVQAHPGQVPGVVAHKGGLHGVALLGKQHVWQLSARRVL